MLSRNALETMFITYSLELRIFRRVSFSRRSTGFTQEKITVGGLLESRVKYENGARLIVPSMLDELTQAIGRGATIALKIDGFTKREFLRSKNIFLTEA
jgi:hypothetical protein